MKKLQICIRYGFIINYINPPLLSLSLSLSSSSFSFRPVTGHICPPAYLARYIRNEQDVTVSLIVGDYQSEIVPQCNSRVTFI